jgi:hypothetical protein
MAHIVEMRMPNYETIVFCNNAAHRQPEFYRGNNAEHAIENWNNNKRSKGPYAQPLPASCYDERWRHPMY